MIKMQDRRANSYKPAVQSQTIISAVVIIICNVAILAGWNIDMEKVTIMVSAVVNIASAGYVIWRRFKTRTWIRGLLSATKLKPTELA